MKQSSFSDIEYAAKKKVTRLDRFLDEIDAVTPWAALVAEGESVYPKDSFAETISWCPGRESNPHALRLRILSPLRLPISSPGRALHCTEVAALREGYLYRRTTSYKLFRSVQPKRCATRWRC